MNEKITNLMKNLKALKGALDAEVQELSQLAAKATDISLLTVDDQARYHLLEGDVKAKIAQLDQLINAHIGEAEYAEILSGENPDLNAAISEVVQSAKSAEGIETVQGGTDFKNAVQGSTTIKNVTELDKFNAEHAQTSRAKKLEFIKEHESELLEYKEYKEAIAGAKVSGKPDPTIESEFDGLDEYYAKVTAKQKPTNLGKLAQIRKINSATATQPENVEAWKEVVTALKNYEPMTLNVKGKSIDIPKDLTEDLDAFIKAQGTFGNFRKVVEAIEKAKKQVKEEPPKQETYDELKKKYPLIEKFGGVVGDPATPILSAFADAVAKGDAAKVAEYFRKIQEVKAKYAKFDDPDKASKYAKALAFMEDPANKYNEYVNATTAPKKVESITIEGTVISLGSDAIGFENEKINKSANEIIAGVKKHRDTDDTYTKIANKALIESSSSIAPERKGFWGGIANLVDRAFHKGTTKHERTLESAMKDLVARNIRSTVESARQENAGKEAKIGEFALTKEEMDIFNKRAREAILRDGKTSDEHAKDVKQEEMELD